MSDAEKAAFAAGMEAAARLCDRASEIRERQANNSKHTPVTRVELTGRGAEARMLAAEIRAAAKEAQ